MNDGIGRTGGCRALSQAVWGAQARLLALLWLFAAVLAMPLVASAQIVASGTGAFPRVGDVSGNEGRAADPALSRPALRASQPADLRFTAERADAKPVPGGPDPFLLPVFKTERHDHRTISISVCGRASLSQGRVCGAAQARAPPSHL